MCVENTPNRSLRLADPDLPRNAPAPQTSETTQAAAGRGPIGSAPNAPGQSRAASSATVERSASSSDVGSLQPWTVRNLRLSACRV